MKDVNPIPLLVLPYEILSDTRLTLRHIRTLMAIFSWRKKNSSLARISREKISERTGYPIARVSEITTELSKLGWITKVGNGGKSQWCEYHINDLEDLENTDSVSQNSNGYQNSNCIDQNITDTVTESVTAGVTESVTVGVTESVTRIDTKRNTKRNYNFFKKEKTFKDLVKEKRIEDDKPTIDDIESFCIENDLGVNPSDFYNHYERYNWKYKGEAIHWKQKIQEWHMKEKDKKKVDYRHLTNEQKLIESEKSSQISRELINKEVRLKEVIDLISYHNQSLERIHHLMKIDGKPLSDKDIQILKDINSVISKNHDIINDEMFVTVLSFSKDKNSTYIPRFSNLKNMLSYAFN
jgi:hypothetical protein